MKLLGAALLPALAFAPPPERCCCLDNGACIGFQKWCRGANTACSESCGTVANGCDANPQPTTTTTTSSTTTSTGSTATSPTTTTTETTTTTTSTADPNNGDCPSELSVLCVAWVRGNSGKIHALIQIGDEHSNPVEGARVVYSTTVDGDPNSVVDATTGDYVFNAYRDDYERYCGAAPFAGVTGNANCFETAPEGADCRVLVESVSLEGCSGANFVQTTAGVDGTCTFKGRKADVPCMEGYP